MHSRRGWRLIAPPRHADRRPQLLEARRSKTDGCGVIYPQYCQSKTKAKRDDSSV